MHKSCRTVPEYVHNLGERYAYQVHSSCQDNSSSQDMIFSIPHHHSHHNSHSGSLPRPSTPPPVAKPMQPSQPSQNQCFAHSKCVGRKKALCVGFPLTIGFLSADRQRLDWNQLSRTTLGT